jgi:hypothetical protein
MIRFETIFAVFAIMLLGTLNLSETSANLSTDETLVATQMGVHATSIADSYVEKLSSPALAFDEYTVSNPVEPIPADSSGKLLSLRATPLGPEAGETCQRLFNDVDDYNGLDTVVQVSGNGTFYFKVHCDVKYFDPSSNQTTGARTWFKKFTVTVTDTVPGSNFHIFKFDDHPAFVKKSRVIGYYKFLS